MWGKVMYVLTPSFSFFPPQNFTICACESQRGLDSRGEHCIATSRFDWYTYSPATRVSLVKSWERLLAPTFSSSTVGVQVQGLTWHFTDFSCSFYYSADRIVNNIPGLDMKEGWRLVNLWWRNENAWKQRQRRLTRLLRRLTTKK